MWRSVGLRLGQHRIWGANLNPALAEHLLLAGISATALHFFTYAWICYQARYIHIFCTTVKAAQLFCLFCSKDSSMENGVLILLLRLLSY